MTDRMDRLNALARKAKGPEGLSAAEQAEQAALRRAFLAEFRSGLTAQLDQTYVQRPDGSLQKLRRREDAK